MHIKPGPAAGKIKESGKSVVEAVPLMATWGGGWFMLDSQISDFLRRVLTVLACITHNDLIVWSCSIWSYQTRCDMMISRNRHNNIGIDHSLSTRDDVLQMMMNVVAWIVQKIWGMWWFVVSIKKYLGTWFALRCRLNCQCLQKRMENEVCGDLSPWNNIWEHDLFSGGEISIFTKKLYGTSYPKVDVCYAPLYWWLATLSYTCWLRQHHATLLYHCLVLLLLPSVFGRCCICIYCSRCINTTIKWAGVCWLATLCFQRSSHGCQTGSVNKVSAYNINCA